MADTSYLDLNSKNGYGEVIRKIVEAKRLPIKKKEDEKKREQQKIAALGELQKELSLLDQAVSRLTGLNSAFAEFKVTSEASDVVTATARRGAKPDSYRIKVVQAPATHRIASADLAPDLKIPAGDFSLLLGAKKVDFRFGGGGMAAFLRLFEKRADLDKRLAVTSVRKASNQTVIVLVSQQSGEGGRIRVASDASGLMETLGFFTRAPLTAPPPEGPLRFARIGERLPGVPPRDRLESKVEGDWALAVGDSLVFEWNATNGAALPAPAKKSNAEGELPPLAPVKSDLALPLTDKLGEALLSEAGAIQLPLLKSFAESRVSELADEEAARRALPPPPPPPPADVPMLTLLFDGFEKKIPLAEALKSSGGRQELRYAVENPGKLLGIALDNRTEQALLTLRSAVERAAANASNAGGDPLRPAHELEPPRPAILEYQGVRVERDQTPVNDLIDGLSIEAKRAREEPVRLQVEWNQEAINQAVINYIGQYNIAMEILNQLLSVDPAGSEVKEEVKGRYGLFKNDQTLSLVKEKLRRLPVDVFPTTQPETLSLFSQLGVSPLFILGNSSDVNIGKLDVKEETLKRMLLAHPDLVSEFFARDSDGDRLPDLGLAVETQRLIKNTGARGSLIDSQREAGKRRIAALEKEIKKDEQDLESYRKKLTTEFTSLEAAQKEFERTRKMLEGAGSGGGN